MTDTEPITLSTAGPFTPEYTKQVAAHAAEAIRVLNHATFDPSDRSALRYPADADTVLVELATMAQRLPQLIEQLSTWLAVQHTSGRIAVTYGTYEGRPGTAAMAAESRLDDAREAADDLYEALNATRQVTAAMSAPHDPAEDPDA